MPIPGPASSITMLTVIGKRRNPCPPKYMWLAKEQFEKQSHHLQLCSQPGLSRDTIAASSFLTYGITQKLFLDNCFITQKLPKRHQITLTTRGKSPTYILHSIKGSKNAHIRPSRGSHLMEGPLVQS